MSRYTLFFALSVAWCAALAGGFLFFIFTH
jgi:hypothetical protein